MKRILFTLTVILTCLACLPEQVLAAGTEVVDLGSSLPIWSCIPFAGMLRCIAILPLVRAEWGEKK